MKAETAVMQVPAEEYQQAAANHESVQQVLPNSRQREPTLPTLAWGDKTSVFLSHPVGASLFCYL